MRKVRIVTHGGAAHRDEFLACCVLLFHELSTNHATPHVERRLFHEEDLTNKSTYVVDTGGQWDPELLNFDHHQADPRLVEKCALDLVLAHVMPEEELKIFGRNNDWLRLTTVQDTRGNAEAAVFLGVTSRSYAISRSPVEIYMLGWFASASVVHADSALHAAMREIGRGLLSSVPDITEQMEVLRRIPGPMNVRGISVWDIRTAWDSGDRAGFSAVNELASRSGVDVVVGHNLRHGKVGLYRQEWSAKKVDLSRIAAHPKHHSSHQNGFYAVVDEDIRDFELLEMIEMARLA